MPFLLRVRVAFFVYGVVNSSHFSPPKDKCYIDINTKQINIINDNINQEQSAKKQYNLNLR